MKRIIYIFVGVALLISACKDDETIFKKSSAERADEAKAALKADLVANPWKVKYQPEPGSGAFWVIMEFKENDQVVIKSDVTAEEGVYFEQTLTYRVDNSLGLELILETYSLFSYLFEQNDASFGAEYEFNYVSKTPDGDLVFTSKTDGASPTLLLFQQADETDESLLGQGLAENLDILNADLARFSSSYKMTYTNKDLELFMSFDPLYRVVNINSGARKSNPTNKESLDFSTGYYLQGDSIVFNSGFSDNVTGIAVNVKGIRLTSISDDQISICTSPTPIHLYSGITSENDQVVLSSTVVDATGAGFIEEGNFYIAPPQNLVKDGETAYFEIMAEIENVSEMQLYWYEDQFYALGFRLVDESGSSAFVLREFSPVIVNNKITFNFADDFLIDGDPGDTDLERIDYYINQIAEGNTTYVYRYATGLYEFNNPCNGWSYVFINAE